MILTISAPGGGGGVCPGPLILHEELGAATSGLEVTLGVASRQAARPAMEEEMLVTEFVSGIVPDISKPRLTQLIF